MEFPATTLYQQLINLLELQGATYTLPQNAESVAALNATLTQSYGQPHVSTLAMGLPSTNVISSDLLYPFASTPSLTELSNASLVHQIQYASLLSTLRNPMLQQINNCDSSLASIYPSTMFSSYPNDALPLNNLPSINEQMLQYIKQSAKQTNVNVKDPVTECLNPLSRISSRMTSKYQPRHFRKGASTIMIAPSTSNATRADDEVRKRKTSGSDASTVEDDTLFIDVESVDDKEAYKGQRKAHINFYRNLKAIRNGSQGKKLECQICREKVENNDSSLREHIYGHSQTALYRCRICGEETKERKEMFEHTKQFHPKRCNVGFEDRRDMVNMCKILQDCFPRGTKTKVSNTKAFDDICRTIEESSTSKVTCILCEDKITPQRYSLSRHAHLHPYYRCRACKSLYPDQQSVATHCETDHHITQPKFPKEYAMCTSAEVMTLILKRCFANCFSDEQKSQL